MASFHNCSGGTLSWSAAERCLLATITALHNSTCPLYRTVSFVKYSIDIWADQLALNWGHQSQTKEARKLTERWRSWKMKHILSLLLIIRKRTKTKSSIFSFKNNGFTKPASTIFLDQIWKFDFSDKADPPQRSNQTLLIGNVQYVMGHDHWENNDRRKRNEIQTI